MRHFILLSFCLFISISFCYCQSAEQDSSAEQTPSKKNWYWVGMDGGSSTLNTGGDGGGRIAINANILKGSHLFSASVEHHPRAFPSNSKVASEVNAVSLFLGQARSTNYGLFYAKIGLGLVELSRLEKQSFFVDNEIIEVYQNYKRYFFLNFPFEVGAQLHIWNLGIGGYLGINPTTNLDGLTGYGGIRLIVGVFD